MDGTIYLLHFAQPYKHARHYIGWTRDLDARIERHFAGHGSKLMQAVSAAGIDAEVVRTWAGDRHLERRLKGNGGRARLCPVCSASPRDGTKLMRPPAQRRTMSDRNRRRGPR